MDSPVSAWRAEKALPQNYRLLMRIDLVRNAKDLKKTTWLSLALAAAALGLGLWLMPAFPQEGLAAASGRFGIGLLGMALYLVGHEAVHGLLMWLFSRQRPRFGFTLMYAYAGSEAYFAKNAYLCIALAPLAVWGVGLAALCQSLPVVWFWPVWLVQVMNLSGSAGDVYVAWRIWRMSDDVLVQDQGVAMTVYSRKMQVG